MSFLAASALGLLSLSVLVTVVYFLKRQAREATVSTLFLWSGLERKPSSALRFNWRDLLSLLLQLIALVAIVLGLAQPVIFSSASGVAKMALLIDSSASMRAHNTNNSGVSRYQQAVGEAKRLLDENPASEAILIRVQEHSQILSMPSHNHADLKRALDGSNASYQGDGDLNGLFGLLQSQETRDFERIVFITDQQPDVDVGVFGWEVVQVGDGSSFNTAITELSVREQPDGVGYGLYIEASNASSEDVTLPLYIYAQDQLIRQDSVRIPAGASAEKTYQELQSGDSRFRVQLGSDEYADQWSEDNARYATVPTTDPWRILWVGEENIYLTRFLDLSEDIELERREAWDEGISPDAYDVVILYNVNVQTPLAGRYVLINSSLTPWVSQGEAVELSDESVSVNVDHPFLYNIDPTVWRFLNVPDAEVDPQGKVLLSIGDYPVLYIFEKAGLRIAYMGASLDTSNLVLSIDFPILIHRLISWMSPRSGQSTTLVAGSEIPIAANVSRITVIDSAGQTCEYAQGLSSCGKVDKPGFYQVFNDGVPTLFAVNPNAEESRPARANLSLADDASVPISGIQANAAPVANLQLGQGIWPYLIALGLLFLLIEYVLFDQSLFSLKRMIRRKSL